jgi:hypothetical protein
MSCASWRVLHHLRLRRVLVSVRARDVQLARRSHPSDLDDDLVHPAVEHRDTQAIHTKLDERRRGERDSELRRTTWVYWSDCDGGGVARATSKVPLDEQQRCRLPFGVCVMALHEDDRVLRKTGAFRDNKNMAILGIVLSAVMLIAFVLIGTPR